ncbi:MAG: SUF system NifU family Fe-S cluster assembly protein [Actinomycetia bacterium]|nr:SUF system NifU family Fe-S cluster assembly protein [Actinomycetes bacterium]
MNLEQMYQEIILDHYRAPKNKGLREPFEAEVHHVNPTCGDEVTLRVHLSDDSTAIQDISYEAQGCSISQASVSVMTELLIGQSIDHDLGVAGSFLEMVQSRGTIEPDEDVLEDAVAFAGVARYPARVKWALLGWMAWKDAVAQAGGTVRPSYGSEAFASTGTAISTTATSSTATSSTATSSTGTTTGERHE